MLAEATVPTTHRWIPQGMVTQYRSKTVGGLTATAELAELPSGSRLAADEHPGLMTRAPDYP